MGTLTLHEYKYKRLDKLRSEKRSSSEREEKERFSKGTNFISYQKYPGYTRDHLYSVAIVQAVTCYIVFLCFTLSLTSQLMMSEYQDYTIAMPMLATPSRKMDTIVHA